MSFWYFSYIFNVIHFIVSSHNLLFNYGFNSQFAKFLNNSITNSQRIVELASSRPLVQPKYVKFHPEDE